MANIFKKLAGSKEARDLIATVAPTLGTALGGPLGGIAGQAIVRKLLGKEAGSDNEALNAVLNASPADLVKLKELDLQFKTDMQNAGIELEQIAASDRNSARGRQMRLGDKMPNVLAVLYTAAFFLHLFAISRGWVAPETLGNASYQNILGALMTGQTMILAYFFGSSSGSASKNQLISDMQNKAKG